MPGIDFDRLRREISMEQILDLLGFEHTQRTGDQSYGACPRTARPPAGSARSGTGELGF
jgi:hypothetical protein